jgi:hypothetical protein
MTRSTLLSSIVRSAPIVALLGLTACGESPVTPVGAAQNSPEAMFAQILDKLGTIEHRIDSLEATLDGSADHTSVLQKLDEIGSAIGGGGGGAVLAALQAAQLDSLVLLASYIAEDASSGSWEVCGEVELAGKGGLEFGGGAEGRGAADAGAWAGTGAHAGAKAQASFEVKGGVELGLAGKIGGCVPLGAGSPPVRPAPAGPLRSAELDGLRDVMASLTSQFNLSPTSVTQSVDGIRTAFQSPGSLTLQNVGGYLPLPPAMAAMASDPLGTAVGRLSGLHTSAQSALCGGSGWGSTLSTIVQEACVIIGQGGLSNVSVFADIADTYPVVQAAVGNICTRVNSIGLQRLIIPSWDVTIINTTYQVFPGYNQRLFGNYTSVACP